MMLCTFTTETGALIVRSDDIRQISDDAGGVSRLVWMVGDEYRMAPIKGTAIENRDRIQQEELDLIDRVNQHHMQAQQQAQMLQQMAQSMQPKVQRGKQAKP
jgi:hypothetical protein